jgi:hypothetical protein
MIVGRRMGALRMRGAQMKAYTLKREGYCESDKHGSFFDSAAAMKFAASLRKALLQSTGICF